MKANELMIGDWVEYGQYITTVRQLSDKIILSGCVGRLDEVRPVPITEEILEANGIKTDSYLEQQLGYKNSSWYVVEDDYGMHKYTQDPVFHFGRLDDTFDGLQSLTLCNIRSVHEFQHALRMIGLSDLADNFIIKKGGQQ